ncbi:MAG: sugar ABC transporter permease [Myxococcales bacterium]|nr:sugar ABC transporter permease [Myxococcota bacterium]MDW8284153.1 sugar ABC transporter permease [Myxococcales bacterium]
MSLRRLATHLVLVVATAVTLYPVLWVVKMALTPAQGFALSPSPLPEQVSLRNFADVLLVRDAAGRWIFLRQALNSLIVASAVTVVGVALSCSAAYALSRFRFPGREASLRAFLFSQMFPGVVTTIPLYVVLEKLHLLNHLGGLVLCYATTAIPFCVFMLKGAFDSLPVELEEAVLLDGGTRFDAFWRVALPLARPAIAVTALFSFLTAWNEFILAATFLSEPRQYTLPVVLSRYVGDYATEWGRFAAGAVLVSVPVMAVFFALQRHLTGGLAQGGVKG